MSVPVGPTVDLGIPTLFCCLWWGGWHSVSQMAGRSHRQDCLPRTFLLIYFLDPSSTMKTQIDGFQVPCWTHSALFRWFKDTLSVPSKQSLLAHVSVCVHLVALLSLIYIKYPRYFQFLKTLEPTQGVKPSETKKVIIKHKR